MQINYLPLSEIEPAIRNPKNHDLDALHESFSRFGFVMPLLKNMTTGRLTVGHGRLEELQRAKEGGQEPPKNIKVEGEEWLVPVIEGHSFKDDTEAEAYLLADNRLVEVGGWTNEELVPILKDLRDRQALAGTGYTTEEVDKYIRQDILEKQQLLDDSDTVMEPPKNPVSQEGDLWALGDHRLMCGDCTDEQAVRRLLGNVEPFLMVTDPPYGVDYDPEWRAEVGLNAREGPAHGLVENDDREDWQLAWRLFPGAVAYIWHPGSGKASEVLASLRAQGFELRTQIIWNKSTFAISRSHYHHKHEPCFYVHKPGTSAKWIGGHDQTTVWDIPKNARNDSGHSTQKPVECMRRPMLNHSSDGHPVYDPFLGSGTSITAAESVGQFCYGLEISPAYCDVIIERWKKLTGGSPRRMNGS